MTILSYGTSMPNFKTTFNLAWGLRAALMILELAIAAFDIVAHSFVALQYTVVENNVTFDTIHPQLPLVSLSLSTPETWMWSPEEDKERRG